MKLYTRKLIFINFIIFFTLFNSNLNKKISKIAIGISFLTIGFTSIQTYWMTNQICNDEKSKKELKQYYETLYCQKQNKILPPEIIEGDINDLKSIIKEMDYNLYRYKIFSTIIPNIFMNKKQKQYYLNTLTKERNFVRDLHSELSEKMD
jgi:hypothetical protein